jgi:spore coat polysaccharide biosynthesis protein SpsF
MNIIGTIEARMGSSRFPGKVLTKIFGNEVLLGLVISRFRKCKEVNDLCVATTDSSNDDLIADWCSRHNVLCYRGSEEDVLDRVSNAATFTNADAVVQMGGDSAYLDFELIDELVRIYKKNEFDFVCNDLTLTYPLGIYGHIVRASTLIDLNERSDLTTRDREDVVRYIWEHPQIYSLKNISAPKELNYPELRLTVDYPEDVQQAIDVYSYFKRVSFNTADIVRLSKEMPSIFFNTKQLVQHSAPFLKR